MYLDVLYSGNFASEIIVMQRQTLLPLNCKMLHRAGSKKWDRDLAVRVIRYV
jgi:hypothetical protein